MKSLYIITFYIEGSDTDKDVEWLWSDNESNAKKEFISGVCPNTYGRVTIDEVYEVAIPKDVIEEIKNSKK